MITNPVKPKRNKLLFSLRIVALVIMLALFIFLLIFNIAPSVIKFGDNGIAVMNSSNMKGEVSKDSLVVYNTKANFDALEKGNVIVFNRLVNGKTIQDTRYFSAYVTDINGNKLLSVYNDTLQDEPYYIAKADFLGVKNKVIPSLGAVFNILASIYGLLICAIIVFVLAFAPILFAKTDSERAKDKRNKRALERQKAYIEKQSKKKVKPVEELGITCYKTDSYQEAEYNEFLKNKCDESELYACPPSCKACRKSKPKGAIIGFSILIVLFVAIIVTVMVMQFGATKFATLDYKTNSIVDAETNALVEYSEFSLSTVNSGDLILVNVLNDKNIQGTALRRYRSHSVSAQGIVEIVTYGTDENVTDAQILGFDDVIGVYRSHNNTMGVIFTFITSTVFYVVLCIAAALILMVIMYYKVNNRVNYIPRLSTKAKRVADTCELATVKAVSTGGKHFSVKILISVVVALALVACVFASLIYFYGVKFEPINSSKGVTESGSYALYHNNGAKYEIGDIVVIEEYIYTAGQPNAIKGTRYIVDIIDGKYYLGSVPGVADTDLSQAYYSTNDFLGKEITSIPRLVAIFDRLGQKDMIIVYICVAAAIVVLIIAATLVDSMNRRRKGLNVKIEANTFALNSDVKNLRKINKLPVAEHLAYCNDDVRRSYNYIVNDLLKYKKSKLVDSNEFDRIFIGREHILTLGIVDKTLFAYVNYEKERFPASLNTADVWEKKWKEPRISVQINDINDAVILTNLFNRELSRNKINKHYKEINYANEYTVKGVLSTDSLTTVKTIK